MIHITNDQVIQALAAVVDKTNKFCKNHPEETSVAPVAASIMSLILSEFGILNDGESMPEFTDRMLAGDTDHSLLNQDHRNLLGRLLREMYAPLGAKRYIVIAVPEDSGIVLCPIQDRGEPPFEMEEVRNILKHILDSDGEFMEL